MENSHSILNHLHFFELSQDLICTAGFDGYFKYINPAWEELLGYSEKEFLSKPFLDFIHPDDHQKNDEEVANFKKNIKTIEFENRYICKDGSIKYIQWKATPVVSEKVMYCVGRDITKQKITEQELSESEEKLRAIFDNSLNAIVVADDLGNYTFANNAAAEMFGYTNEELLKMNVGQLRTSIPSNAAKLYEKYIEKGYEVGEFRFIKPNGDERIAQYHAVRIKENLNLSILTDISEYKKTEEKLKLSEEKFSNAFENSPVPSAIYNLITGERLDVNNSFCKSFGYSKSEILGENILSLNTAVNQEEFKKIIKKALKERSVFESQVLMRTKSDKVKDVLVNMSKLNPERDDLYIASYLDITEKKRAVQELILAKEKAEESENELKFIFDTMTEGIALNECIYNEHGEMIDYKILDVNKVFYDIADYNGDIVIGKYASQLYGMSHEIINSFWKEHKKNNINTYNEFNSSI